MSNGRFVPVLDEWAMARAEARAGGRAERRAAGGTATLTPAVTTWQELTRLELPTAQPLAIQTARTDVANGSVMPRASNVLVRGKLEWGIESAAESAEFDFHEGRTIRLVASSVRVFAMMAAGSSAGVVVQAAALAGPANIAGSVQAVTYTVPDVAAGVEVPIPRRAAGVRLYTGAADLTGVNYGNARLDFCSVGAFARAIPSGPGEVIPIPWPARYVRVAAVAGALLGSVHLLWELQL